MFTRLLLSSALVLFYLPSEPAKAAATVPDWTLTSSTGKPVRLSEEAIQQTTVLFFWATWCPYCKALMPHLQSLRDEHGDKIKILAINFREDADPVAFIREAGYDFTVLPDGDEVASAYGIYGTPGLIIVDSDRQVLFDLRTLPEQAGRTSDRTTTSTIRAAFWAAEIRKSLAHSN